MIRQVCNRQGRTIKPLQAIIFFVAMLLFIFTVVYRMAKSDSFNNALAALVESLLIVAFFIFIGIVIAYLLYFIYERFHQGPNRRQTYQTLSDLSAKRDNVGKLEEHESGLKTDENTKPQPNS